MISREGVRDFLKISGIDAAFIQKDENCRYLSGFTGSESYLFLTKEESYLLTDSRYTEQAAEEAPSFVIVNCAGKLPSVIQQLAEKHHAGRIGIESVLTYKTFLSFQEAVPSAEFIFCDPDALRYIL